MAPPTYAVITPVRDEAENLPRLAASLAQQTVLPCRWLIIDNGSTDGTPAIAEELSSMRSWISTLSVPGEATAIRGRPIVRALHAGLAALDEPPDIVVNVDADVSMDRQYFEQLLEAFARDPRLGIASGSGWERRGAQWRQRHLTGSTVWGATRAYRWACLQDVLPLEERLGWDGIDEFKANARGWRTATLTDLPFRHHRAEGHRDGGRHRVRAEHGRAAHYMGYRFSYLILRALFHAPREPAALAMIAGYSSAALRRQQRCPDAAARAYVRRQQSLRLLPLRAREVLGRTAR
jgi:biofilm PGA synthesis N-glycosyltransferase PgaC